MPISLSIAETKPGMAVQWVDGRNIYASSNHSVYLSRDGLINFRKIAVLKVPLPVRLMGSFPFLRRALRIGIKDLRVLKSGTMLVIANSRIFRSTDSDFLAVHKFRHGSGPLRRGWCEDASGNCYLGEYFFNNKRRNNLVNLLKSSDDGRSWHILCSWPDIRHIHFVQYDPFTGEIWLGTGDTDSESRIMALNEAGETRREVCGGDQKYRAVSLIFTEEYVYWGSDSPTRQNHVYRYHRSTGEIETLAAVDGPVYYALETQDGTKLLATTAEGKSEGSSAAWDTKARIWASRDGSSWEDIASWEKDLWPYLLGYGRIDFAYGNYGNDVYFTGLGLKGIGGKTVKANVAPTLVTFKEAGKQ